MTDFQRLILALPPPRSSDGVLDRESLRTPSSARPVNTAPTGQTPDSYSNFFRSDGTLRDYLVPGGNPTTMAESVRSWFQGNREAAIDARNNYIARDTALSITFVAFHESRNLEERRRLLTYFVEGVRGTAETLRLLRREGRPESLSDSADAILRLSILVGLFLRDLEGSEIPSDERRRGQDELQASLRQAYQIVDGAVGGNHPEWRHLQEFVRAMDLAQEAPHPDESMGRHVDWIREIHEHLNQAEAALSDRSEYR